ncbi:hypothetical protein [Halalkalibacterium ligniniphilum]|uniref:hypothetical protein n=1 Tax=Halalkalibacterium ligniniphilum TaxID=1134413 RepID=UPI00034BDA9F|nr:hypothetical protein [Halalkalibacterium ligniniphilum]
MTNSWSFEQHETAAVLDCIGENIFIADLSFRLVWMNQSAYQLIDGIKEHLLIEKAEELIGLHLNVFHPRFEVKQKVVLEEKLPYETRIHLFNKYFADIKVSGLKNREGERAGYILNWRDVTKEARELKETQELIEEISTPILATMVEGALLVPLIGTFDRRRFELLQKKLLQTCVDNATESLIFDFEGITANNSEEFLSKLGTLASTVTLIGAQPIFVGFPIEVVKKMVTAGLKRDVKTFRTFRQASHYLLKKQGLDLNYNTCRR